MPESVISSTGGVLAVLCLVAAFWFFVEQTTQWKLFQYLPPLIFIYATPVFLNNFGVIPSSSPVYSGLSSFVLPAFIVLMLIKVNVPAAVRIMGKGVLVMLMGTAGVVVGGVVSYLIVHRWLDPDTWKGVGALAGGVAPHPRLVDRRTTAADLSPGQARPVSSRPSLARQT